MMDGLFLLLGSNIPGQKDYLHKAKNELLRLFREPVGQSSIYRTEPWGNTNQEWFLNQVLVFEIPVSNPEILLEQIKAVEKKAGRMERERWGPREIDIDVLYWHDLIFKNSSLSIPHVAIPERKFTLIPLVEIAPNKIHPVLEKSQEELLKECTDSSKVIKEKLLDTSHR